MTEPWLRTLAEQPRFPFVLEPTPLILAPRLSEAVGCEIWLKRDDLTGRALGGNKSRTLEYLLGDARLRGCDAFVTGAGPQSNWAMLAALSSRMAGMEPVVAHYGSRVETQGNLVLSALVGAEISFTGDPARESVDALVEELAEDLSARGRTPYVAPRGGATAIGSFGYVRAAVELIAQLDAASLKPAALWLPTGSCGTQAGLLAGMTGLGRDLDVVGVATSRSPTESASRVRTLAGQALKLLGIMREPGPPIIVGGFLGGGYGQPTPEGMAAAELVARTEGVLLDPVFGAKAMAALLSAIRGGSVSGPVVYLVTGGGPTLFVKVMSP